MRMIIDTREQSPYKLPCETIVTGLKTGDYSIEGYENTFCIERKSIADLVSTCGHKERDRFKRELQRMKDEFEFYCILIDGERSDVLPYCLELHEKLMKDYHYSLERGLRPKRPISPHTRAKVTTGSLKSWRSGFNCHYYFTGSREMSQKLAYDMAKRFVYNMEKRND